METNGFIGKRKSRFLALLTAFTFILSVFDPLFEVNVWAESYNVTLDTFFATLQEKPLYPGDTITISEIPFIGGVAKTSTMTYYYDNIVEKAPATDGGSIFFTIPDNTDLVIRGI